MAKKSDELRRRAQEILLLRKEMPIKNITDLSTDRILEELSIYQIELDLQNEELLQKQEELEKAKNNFEDLFDSAPNGYLEINHEMAILKCNLTFASMIGLSRQNLINTRLSDYLRPDFQDTVYLKCKEVFKNKSLANCEVEIKTAFGKDLQVRLDGKHVFQNGFDFIRVSIIDITGQKEAEKELLEKSKEVTAQNEELQAQNEQLAAQNLEIAENNNELMELNLLLKLEKEKAQSYLDLAGVMFVAIGADEKVFLANQKASEILQLPQDELVGKNWFDNFVPAAIRNQIKGVFKKILNGEVQSLDEYENGIINSHGVERIILWRNTVLRDLAGNPIGTLSSGADITERKRAVEQLRLSENKLRTIFSVAPTGIGLIIDREIIDVNPKVCEMTGYEKSELIGKNSRLLYSSEEEYNYVGYEKYRQIAECGLGRVETHWMKKDGTIIDILLSSSPIDVDDLLKGVIFTALDITDRKADERKIRESAIKWQTTFDGISDGVMLLDSEGSIKQINKGACYLLGKSENELLERHCFEMVHCTKTHIEDCPFVRMKTSLKRESMLMPVNSKWFEIIVDPLFDEKGQIAGAVHIVSDITNRKLAEEALRESEEKYRTLIETANEGFWLMDEKHVTKYVNEAMAKMIGYSMGEMLGKKVEDFFFEEDLLFHQERMAKRHRGEDEIYERRFRRKDGSELWTLVSARSLKDKQGNFFGSFALFTDITQRKSAEETILKSEKKFRTYIEHSPTSIFVADANGNYTFVNMAAANLLGYTEAELLQMSIPDILPHSELQKGLVDFNLVKTNGYSNDNQLKFKRKNGAIIDVIIASVKLNDNEFMAYCRDITDLKNTQRELQLKNEEYQALNEELQQNFDKIRQINDQLKIARAQAEESDRLKSAFLANMSHEIRTPMNGILGFADLLKEPDLTGDEQQKYISIIEKSGQRMLNIINDLIDISKIEAGQMEVSITQTNVNQHINNLFVFFRPEAERNGLSLSFQNSLPDSEANINTDSEKLYAILTNLIKNAIKYTHRGSIEFGYKIVETLHATSLKFFVKDTGIGIKKEKLEAIFERFVQADTMITKPYEGAGLGLSISKAYCEMLGGKIGVESEFGVGSTFWFTIPTQVKEQENERVKDVHTILPVDEKPLNLKILIAEDTEASDIYLSQLVRKISTQVTHVTTGTEAVRHCRTHPEIDLILMDIKMPEMDGYEATRRIREFNKNVLIIAQTAYALAGDREKALAAGCNDYLPKPIKKAVLIETIRKYF